MIEVGQRDLLGSGKLDLKPFLGNRGYLCVDLIRICHQKPAIMKELVLQISHANISLPRMQLTSKPRTIHIAFSNAPSTFYRKDMSLRFSDARSSARRSFSMPSNAYRTTSPSVRLLSPCGDALGKIQLDASAVVPAKVPVRFDSAASYLLIGGLGGLGRSISTWMVRHGACHIIFLSRSAGTSRPDHRDLVVELTSMGCRVDLVAGSVVSAARCGRCHSESRRLSKRNYPDVHGSFRSEL